MKTLTEEASESQGKLRGVQTERSTLRHLAGITQSPVWPHYKAWLEAIRDKARESLESMSSVDPFEVGKTCGKLDLLKQIFALEGFIEERTTMLASREKTLKAKVAKQSEFQTRQHTGAGL